MTAEPTGTPFDSFMTDCTVTGEAPMLTSFWNAVLVMIKNYLNRFAHIVLYRAVVCLALCTAIIATNPAHAQIFRLPPPDTTAGNFFGSAVAIDGRVAIVGASGDSRCGENGGAAYIYELNDRDDWMATATLRPGDCREGLFFGKAVAVSGDRVIVTAFQPYFSNASSNTVYIFERNPESGVWEQTARLRQDSGETEGAFAASVSLDGNRILVTTSGDTSRGRYGGAAYMYDFDGNAWNLSGRLTGSLGPRAGVFGASSALDGDRAAIAASTYLAGQPGAVYMFDRNPDTGEWLESYIIRGIDDFFISIDVDGDRILVGESRGKTGRARLFERDPDGIWRTAASLKPSARFSQGGFGSLVSLEGDHALIVGFEEQLSFEFNIDRVVYLFEYDPDKAAWRQKHIIDVGDVAFGSSLNLGPGAAIIGQASDQRAGQAYVVLIR